MDIEYLLIRFNLWAGLLLTIAALCYLCYMMKTDRVPVIYYMNLLISNLILFCSIVTWIFVKHDGNVIPDNYETITVIHVIVWFAVMSGLIFSVCFALERCFAVTSPQLQFIRKTKPSVLLCVGVWVICAVTVPLTLFLRPFILLSILFLLPAPVFIVCLAQIIKSLPAATLMPAEEKRRTLAILVLLLLHHTLTILPITVYHIAVATTPSQYFHYAIVLAFFLLGPFVDLILCLFLSKGPVDMLLKCLCCCETDNNVDEDIQHTTSV